MSSSRSIPEPADTPDPSNSNDWDPSPGESISGHVHDRETVQFKRTFEEGQPTSGEVLSIATGDGNVTRVPCFRTHLRELLALNDPRPDDGISVTYFGPNAGEKKERYAMRVSKQTPQDSLLDAEPSETAKAARAVNAPLDREVS